MFQVVWKDTKRVGVAMATKKDEYGFTVTYIVARFSPQGNIDGQFAENVKESKYCDGCLKRKYIDIEGTEPTSSIGNGGSSAEIFRSDFALDFLPEFCARFFARILRSHFSLNFALAFFARILKLYVFPIESAFEYSHQLNRNESSNGFHILRSHFKFTYSVAFSENHGSVTFSEIDDVI